MFRLYNIHHQANVEHSLGKCKSGHVMGSYIVYTDGTLRSYIGNKIQIVENLLG